MGCRPGMRSRFRPRPLYRAPGARFRAESRPRCAARRQLCRSVGTVEGTGDVWRPASRFRRGPDPPAHGLGRRFVRGPPAEGPALSPGGAPRGFVFACGHGRAGAVGGPGCLSWVGWACSGSARRLAFRPLRDPGPPMARGCVSTRLWRPASRFRRGSAPPAHGVMPGQHPALGLPAPARSRTPGAASAWNHGRGPGGRGPSTGMIRRGGAEGAGPGRGAANVCARWEPGLKRGEPWMPCVPT